MATIRYIVTNVGEAVHFYCDHLGFTIANDMRPAFASVSSVSAS